MRYLAQTTPSANNRAIYVKHAGPPPGTEVTALHFEKALAKLEEIVKRLERGEVSLEESIAIYERGEALKKHCEALLKRAEARIEKITVGPNGEAAGLAPLDPDS